MINDFCMPRMVSANMSNPFCVVPNQCSGVGVERNAFVSSWSYCHVLKYGLTYATANSTATIIMPVSARRCRRNRLSTSWPPEVASTAGPPLAGTGMAWVSAIGTGSVGSITIGLNADARIERRVRDVGEEAGNEHEDGDEQRDAGYRVHVVSCHRVDEVF